MNTARLYVTFSNLSSSEHRVAQILGEGAWVSLYHAKRCPVPPPCVVLAVQHDSLYGSHPVVFIINKQTNKPHLFSLPKHSLY
jgi:hypothetical protein